MIRLYTKSIVYHHSVTPQGWGERKTVNNILSSHKTRGLAYDGRIAYHWLIGKNWTYQGRPLNTVGYHAGHWTTNLTSVAICLVGNFNDDTPTEYQLQELSRLTGDLNASYGKELKRYLHRDIKATSCPGENVTHELINAILADMTDKEKQSYEKEIRKLNTEIAEVTAARDAFKDQLDEEVKLKQEMYDNWQSCLDKPDDSKKLRETIEKIKELCNKV